MFDKARHLGHRDLQQDELVFSQGILTKDEMMTERENYLRAVEFRHPDWIPCAVGLSLLTWHTHREEVERIVSEHPRLFPDHQPGSVDFDRFPPVYREGEYYRDNWGCLWYTPIGGLEGQVVESPLADWDAMDSYGPPDFLTQGEREPRDWRRIESSIRDRREKGRLTMGDGERLFDRLYFLRGFENLMIDIATEDPRLHALIEMLTEYEKALIVKWLEIGVDVMGFHTDIGTQDRLMISPHSFRKFLKPMFKTLFSICRKAGSHVLLSSDGNLLEIVDDLIECGVSVHDPQLRANTLEGIEKHYKGKLCINLDLDRQGFAFCRPEDIRNQVREAVDRLALPEGGLMVSGSVYDDAIPLANIEALCDAMETVCLDGYSA